MLLQQRPFSIRRRETALLRARSEVCILTVYACTFFEASPWTRNLCHTTGSAAGPSQPSSRRLALAAQWLAVRDARAAGRVRVSGRLERACMRASSSSRACGRREPDEQVRCPLPARGYRRRIGEAVVGFSGLHADGGDTGLASPSRAELLCMPTGGPALVTLRYLGLRRGVVWWRPLLGWPVISARLSLLNRRCISARVDCSRVAAAVGGRTAKDVHCAALPGIPGAARIIRAAAADIGVPLTAMY